MGTASWGSLCCRVLPLVRSKQVLHYSNFHPGISNCFINTSGFVLTTFFCYYNSLQQGSALRMKCYLHFPCVRWVSYGSGAKDVCDDFSRKSQMGHSYSNTSYSYRLKLKTVIVLFKAWNCSVATELPGAAFIPAVSRFASTQAGGFLIHKTYKFKEN